MLPLSLIKKKIYRLGIMGMLVLSLVVSGLVHSSPSQKSVALDPLSDDIEQRVEALLGEMDLRQKVGQVFMVHLYGTQFSPAQLRFLETYQPGAVVLATSHLDGHSPSEVSDYVNRLQALSEIPLLVALDQEGGRIQRAKTGFTALPNPIVLGAADDGAVSFALGEAMGRELAGVGINMNLAPVVDLQTRLDARNNQRVLHHRTMSDNAQVVGEMAGSLIQGMEAAGVVGTLKHFPGHSPTDTDSHAAVASVSLDFQTANDTNFRAFRLAIQAGAPVVMVGHLYYPQIEPIPQLPASLSPTMIGILRDDLGFEGVIMTDAMEMGGIVTQYTIPQAAVMAIQAGVDVVTMGPNAAFIEQENALEAVYQAVLSGELSETQLDEAVRRVLRVKARHGVLDWVALEPSEAPLRMQVEATRQTLISTFEAAISIVDSTHDFLPLGVDESVAIIYPIGKPLLLQACSASLPNAVYQGYSFEPAQWEYGASVAVAQKADKVVVIAENIGINVGQKALVEGLPLEKTLFVSLWQPYDWEALTVKSAAFGVTYSTSEEAQLALCRVLAGEVEARGRIPIDVRGLDIESE